MERTVGKIQLLMAIKCQRISSQPDFVQRNFPSLWSGCTKGRYFVNLSERRFVRHCLFVRARDSPIMAERFTIRGQGPIIRHWGKGGNFWRESFSTASAGAFFSLFSLCRLLNGPTGRPVVNLFEWTMTVPGAHNGFAVSRINRLLRERCRRQRRLPSNRANLGKCDTDPGTASTKWSINLEIFGSFRVTHSFFFLWKL